MISIAAGIVAVSSFLPQVTLIVNASPGVRVEIVEMKTSGEYVKANSFITSYTASSRPRKVHVRTHPDTKALCAQTRTKPGGPNTLSVVYRSCSLLPPKPTKSFRL